MADSTTLSVVDAKGKSTGSVDLPAAIFDVQTNVPLIHQVVTAQLAAARQGPLPDDVVAETKRRLDAVAG